VEEVACAATSSTGQEPLERCPADGVGALREEVPPSDALLVFLDGVHHYHLRICHIESVVLSSELQSPIRAYGLAELLARVIC
jgi:hypothetical protein